MRRKLLKYIAMCMAAIQLIGMCANCSYAQTQQDPRRNTVERKTLQENQLYAKSCALTDGASDRLLYGKAQTVPLANASTTKIMTCILALEECETDEIVTVSAKAAGQPKVHLGIQEGEQFYLKDLLYGLMLESFNDCAYAIAEHVAGSAEAFALRMNEKAEKIGCKDTHFVTPNGLDGEDAGGEHHTTAADLCRIMSYCTWKSSQSGQFVALTQTRDYSFANLDGRSFSVSNKNAFLDMMDCVVTGKTGFTGKAGYCYVAAAEEGGRRYCIALLACGWPNNKNYKWKDARVLLQYGLDHYHLYRCDQASLKLPPLEIGNAYEKQSLDEWGKRIDVKTYIDAKESSMTFLKADWDEAEITRSFSKIVRAPLKKGDSLGRVSYTIGGQEIYAFDICAGKNVFRWDFTAFLHALWKEITI